MRPRLGAAMTVAATVDDPVAVETAPLVDETPSAKLLRDAARKREGLLLRMALFNQARISR